MPSPSVSLGWLAGHSMHILDESQHLWVVSEPVVFGSVQEVCLPVLVQVSGIPDSAERLLSLASQCLQQDTRPI